MSTSEKTPSIFTPDNEPYLGRQSVYHFDELIVSCLQSNQNIAQYTHEEKLSPLQKAASQIIPQGINLALSIRELVRQGYLFSALVLQRPFIERVAIAAYLNENPDKVHQWEDGWRHNNRPSFREMLSAMSDTNDEKMVTVAETLNHLVHGDPVGAEWNLVQDGKTGLGYSVSKVIDDPELCDFVCIQTQMYLVVLMNMMTAYFPDV